MLQSVVVGLIFIAAISYIAWLVYQNMRAKSACSSGCGKCNAIDFAKLEKQLEAKGHLPEK